MAVKKYSPCGEGILELDDDYTVDGVYHIYYSKNDCTQSKFWLYCTLNNLRKFDKLLYRI